MAEWGLCRAMWRTVLFHHVGNGKDRHLTVTWPYRECRHYRRPTHLQTLDEKQEKRKIWRDEKANLTGMASMPCLSAKVTSINLCAISVYPSTPMACRIAHEAAMIPPEGGRGAGGLRVTGCVLAHVLLLWSTAKGQTCTWIWRLRVTKVLHAPFASNFTYIISQLKVFHWETFTGT